MHSFVKVAICVGASVVVSAAAPHPLKNSSPKQPPVVSSPYGAATSPKLFTTKAQQRRTIATCADVYESDIQMCRDDSFISPNNAAYAICINLAFASYMICKYNTEHNQTVNP